MDWGPIARDHLADKMMFVLEASEAFIRAGQAEGAFADRDVRQLLISLLGVYFMPFAVGGIVNRFVGADPATPAFIEPRRGAVIEHVRRLVLKK
jgi:hypothetical protein